MKAMLRRLDNRGAVAAELALLLPVLMMLLFGVIEFGMIMYGREVVTNAVREGARAGIIMKSPPVSSGEMIAVARSYLTGSGVNPANVEFTPAPTSGGPTGNPIIVTAIYHYPWLIPYIPTVIGLPSPLDMTVRATMLHE